MIEGLVILLFLSIITYPIVRIGWFMKDILVINIGSKEATAEAIEWTNRTKLVPYGFIVTCPHCRKKQWFKKSKLYIAHDNSKKNLRCLYCGVGKQPKRMWDDPDYQSHPQFRPKNPGWKSTRKDF